MNLGKKVHLALALAGLGTFLLVVPAHAQQETDPDHFTLTGVEAFPEAAKAVPTHRAKAMRARLSAQLARAKMVAANRRDSTRVGSKERAGAVATRHETAAEEKETAALTRR